MNLQMILQTFLDNVDMIGVSMLLTMGLTLTFKTANVANFAQAITAVVGAYVAVTLVTNSGVNQWAALVIGVVSCFLLGFIIDAVIVRNVGGGSGRVMVIIALMMIITALIPFVFGTIPFNLRRFFSGQIQFTLFGAGLNITENSIFILAASVVVVGAIFAALHFTKWGLGVRGTASNTYVAAMMGVNTHMMTALSWGISSACGALAAILQGSATTGQVSGTMLGTIPSFAMLAFALCGFSTFYGPVVGGVLIAFVYSLLAFIDAMWASSITYVLVILVILFKPNGIIGKKIAKKV